VDALHHQSGARTLVLSTMNCGAVEGTESTGYWYLKTRPLCCLVQPRKLNCKVDWLFQRSSTAGVTSFAAADNSERTLLCAMLRVVSAAKSQRVLYVRSIISLLFGAQSLFLPHLLNTIFKNRRHRGPL
jgi:hypothetical protein